MVQRGGFTLIELLVVVAIISILSAIAVPNFLEAQVRAKVSRIKADSRSLVTAIEAYAVDYNKYPYRESPLNPGPPPSQLPIPDLEEKIYVASDPTSAKGMHTITTPIAYIGSLPKDIFNVPVAALSAPGNPYSDCIEYWDANQVQAWMVGYLGQSRRAKVQTYGYVVFSVGPDQYLGGPANAAVQHYPVSSFTLLSYQCPYDPTNGTVSTGNIQRFASLVSPTQSDLLF